jgi:outer membrane protein assembly factor BamE (lipoprotein component of BamABCDE complex)
MNTRKLLLPLVAAVAAFSFVGCSTTASRIRHNPDLFASYAPDQQELIKKGQVAVGFDKGAVRLALGDPDRVRTRTTNDGTSEIWSYVTYETIDGYPLYRGWYHRRWAWYPWYTDYPARVAHEHFRVIFDRNGRVSTIEQEVS